MAFFKKAHLNSSNKTDLSKKIPHINSFESSESVVWVKRACDDLRQTLSALSRYTVMYNDHHLQQLLLFHACKRSRAATLHPQELLFQSKRPPSAISSAPTALLLVP